MLLRIKLSWICGVKLPFFSSPGQTVAPQEPVWSQTERNNLKHSIEKLLELGAIRTVKSTSKQFVSNVLTPKPDGSQRMILNLKKLNTFLRTCHFKQEDYRTASQLIFKNSYMVTLDLKDAYLLVNIDKSHRKYLRFKFLNVFYEYTSMPFGLSVAPYIFTKIMKPLVRKLREKGFLLVIYLNLS